MAGKGASLACVLLLVAVATAQFNLADLFRPARPPPARRPPPPQRPRQQQRPNTFSRPSTNTFSQPSTSSNTFSRPSPNTNTFNRPSSNTNTFSQQQQRPNTFSRPSTNTNTFSRPRTNTNTFSRPSTNTNTFSRPSTNTNTVSRPSTNTNTFNQASPNTNTFSRPSGSSSNSPGVSPPRGGRVITIPLPKDASGNDVYPDCNRGKVCLPVAEQCSTRQSKVGATTFQNKTYWISWHNDEQVLRNGSWNWFTARNYCRKRCMDLVSFETEAEWELVKGFMSGAGVREIWTAGRLCDSEVSGCEADHYQPLNINGWFWASTLIKMLPTNRPIGLNPDGVRVIGVNEWGKTGDRGKPQPDGFTPPGGLGEEPCMAVIDGAWHDTSCNNRRAIVCEDLPQQNIQFVRNENPGINIP